MTVIAINPENISFELGGYQEAMSDLQRSLSDPAAMARIKDALARSNDGTRAYSAGAEAWEHGDLRLAATQFRVAAGYRTGDAALRLAEVLLYLGDPAAALAWCAVVSADGEFPEEVEALIERCYTARAYRSM